MKERRIALLAMKVFGLYVAFRGLNDLLRASGLLFRSFDVSILSSGVISGVVLMAVGAVIWIKAERLGARALGSSLDDPDGESRSEDDETQADDNAGVGVTLLDVQSVALTVLGVYLVAAGLGEASGAIGEWIAAGRSSSVGYGGAMASYAQSLLYSSGLYVVVGLALTFGARGLAGMFGRVLLRGRGVVRANRVELVDFSGTIRGQLAIEESIDGRQDAALTFFDKEDRGRIKVGIDEQDEPGVTVFDSSGATALRLPPAAAAAHSESSTDV